MQQKSGMMPKRAVLFWVWVILVLGQAQIARGVVPDPRDPGPFPTDVTLIDEGCSYDLDGTSLTWTDPLFGFSSPTTVVFGDNDFSGSDTRCPGSPAVLVDMKVRVHYPGSGGVVAAGGPFPLVIFLHGQQFFSIPGYEGYDYLGQLLASHGFIVASIDGRSLLDSTIKSRGEHIREHLRRFVTRNAPGSGSFLSEQIDLSKVTLVGHSRGGDAVAAAWEWQRVDPDPGYSIAAIVAIAPVQFFGVLSAEPSFISHIRDVAYQIIHGSHDCDVSDFQGYREYDRAADIRAVGETLKSMVFVKDANHNFFNTVWETSEGSDCGSGAVLAGSVARDIAKVYIHSFLETVIKGRTDFRQYLTGEASNPVAGTTVAVDFQAPGSQFVPLDHFEELPGVAHDKTRNSQGGPVTATNMAYDELRFAATETFPRSTYTGETYGGYLLWSMPTAQFVSRFPALFDPRPQNLTHLSFRVGQIFRSTGSPNPPGANQDFSVVVRIGNFVHKVRVSAFDPIYPPFPALVGGTKTVMSVVRIPLTAFSNTRVPILGVEFYFDQIGTGEIVVDDIRFTR